MPLAFGSVRRYTSIETGMHVNPLICARPHDPVPQDQRWSKWNGTLWRASFGGGHRGK